MNDKIDEGGKNANVCDFTTVSVATPTGPWRGVTTDDGDLIRPETDAEVAEKLGVSQPVVSEVIKNIDSNIIYHDRVKVREYYDGHNDPESAPGAVRTGY